MEADDNKGKNKTDSLKKRNVLLKTLLDEHPGLMETMLNEEEWMAFRQEQRLSEKDNQRIYAAILRQTSYLQTKRRLTVYLPGWYAVAGMLLMVASLAILWRWQISAQAGSSPLAEQASVLTPVWKIITNKEEQIKKIWLEDGSVVLLHKTGIIRFKEPMSDTERTIYLTGTARFDVAKDPARPFTVFVNDFATTALGTAFTIAAPGGETNISVLLHNGKVRLWREGRNKDAGIQLSVPGQRGIFSRRDERIVLEPAAAIKNKSSARPMMDKQGTVLSIHNAPLNKVLNRLALEYGVAIRFDKNELGKISYTGTIDTQSEAINDVLSIICTLNDLKLFDNGNQDYNITGK